MTTTTATRSEGSGSLLQHKRTYQRLQLNYSRNKKQDHTAKLDAAAAAFDFEACKDQRWNPDAFSLLFGTPVWEGATERQRTVLNQLYWLAYYSQIISAEIATIYFNQTSAAGLYALEDFRLICDTLDLESTQERAHIHAFQTVSRTVEEALFGERVFSYPMRGPFAETMIFADTTPFRERWKRLQLKTYGLLSSGSAFIACQYFTVRGLRTLNGKMIQHKLAAFWEALSRRPAEGPGEGVQGRAPSSGDEASAPIPSAISHYHFQDESYHFNSSMLISQDVLKCLRRPTPFEQRVTNLAIRGCQRDHFHFSVAINGIFWHDPALFPTIYRVLRSRHFGMGDAEALEMIRRCFCEDSEALQRSYQTHEESVRSYRKYVEDMDYLWPENREMALMARSDVGGYLARNRAAFRKFASSPDDRSRPAAEPQIARWAS